MHQFVDAYFLLTFLLLYSVVFSLMRRFDHDLIAVLSKTNSDVFYNISFNLVPQAFQTSTI